MNIFEQAVKFKLRFMSDRGLLMVEQLYDLSLSKLNQIAMGINKELKSLAEESFVDLRPDPRKSELELQLEVIKHVIKDKLEEKDKLEQIAQRANKRRILLEALESKENEELRSMSKEDIIKALESVQ